jgi:hypothetical protein
MILHDNHGAHKSYFVKDWISENPGDPERILIEHPARSPDLNPCEHLGAMLKRLVSCQHPAITDVDVLWKALLSAHQMLVENRQFFFNLINSMPQRMQEVLHTDGNVTRYKLYSFKTALFTALILEKEFLLKNIVF